MSDSTDYDPYSIYESDKKKSKRNNREKDKKKSKRNNRENEKKKRRKKKKRNYSDNDTYSDSDSYTSDNDSNRESYDKNTLNDIRVMGHIILDIKTTIESIDNRLEKLEKNINLNMFTQSIIALKSSQDINKKYRKKYEMLQSSFDNFVSKIK